MNWAGEIAAAEFEADDSAGLVGAGDSGPVGAVGDGDVPAGEDLFGIG